MGKARRAKKPFFFRTWFIVLLSLGLLAGAVAFIVYSEVERRYTLRASEFDLKDLDKMESASIIFDRNKDVFGHIYINNRDRVGFDQISDNMVKALIAIEDARFYEHDGVDVQGIIRAAVKNLGTGRIKEGASTITQQLARNSFGLKERSYERKLIEIFLAKRIEKQYSKQQILELYLNRIYFGSGFYGVEAASQGYFGKNAKDLTVAEAATLAGLIRSPTNLSPWNDKEASKVSRDYVLSRMLEFQKIDKITYDQAVAAPVTVLPKKSFHVDNYAMDVIRQQVIAKVGFEQAAADGYRVYTTIDSTLQKTAEESLNKHLEEIEARREFRGEKYADYDAKYRAHVAELLSNPATAGKHPLENFPEPTYLQGALIAINNKDGGIVALVGGRNFKHHEYNRASSPTAKRPAGTAFKPIVYLAAFVKGMFPGTLISDSVMDNRLVMIGGESGILGEWGPERIENHYEGEITARRALVQSKNAATVRLGFMVGLDNVLALAKKLGISSPLREYSSTFLGSGEQTLAELTEAYTVFPNGGIRPEGAAIVDRIEKKDGTLVWQRKPATVKVTEPEPSYEVHSILKEALAKGTGSLAYEKYGLQRFEAGGKTGTAYNFTDTTFVGYSSEITCGVWAGFDRPHSIFRGAFSNQVVLPVWVDVMNAAVKVFPPGKIDKPPTLTEVEICTASGLKATDRCFEEVDAPDGQKVKKRCTHVELASAKQVPQDFCDVHGEGFRSFVKVLPGEEWPRAVPAADLDAVAPILVQAQTILGPSDPYSSIKPAWARKTAGQDLVAGLPGFKPAEKTEVRRAEAVRPFEQILNESVANLERPAPIQF